ncbi:MAG: hypothetical protein PUP46_05125 [Endozoicomonas sp. (ex Botrylloides leachii)]|nr:hypothetical protein [Endozoicomonas sp. (ex Botrylloides leachii)]
MVLFREMLTIIFLLLRAICFSLLISLGSAKTAHAESLNKTLFALEPIILVQEKTSLNPTGCTMQDMIKFYKAELNIPNANVTFLKKRMKNPGIHGYAQRIGSNYLIVLAKNLEPSELRIVMAHELVHIRQFLEGMINESEFKKDYLERSFEDEAFRLSLILAAAFYQQVNCSDLQHS